MSKRTRTKSHRPRPTVQLWEGADLLRHVPELAGVDTADSLVLVVFGRGQVKRYRSLGAMRIDLLHTDDELELTRWAEQVLGMALRVADVVGVAAVAYTPETFASDGRPPAALQLQAISRQAQRMGLDMVNRFCVAADGWGSLDDPELPRGGRPLSEIEPPEGRSPRPRDAAVITMAPGQAQEVFQRHYREWWERSNGTGGVLHGVALAQPGSSFGVASASVPAMQRFRWGADTETVVRLVEAMLQRHEHDAGGPCPCRALLFALAERQGIENLVLVQFAWGRRFATESWRMADGAADERTLRRFAAAMSGGAFRRPSAERIERAVEVLLEVATYVQEADRAPIDGMLAWLFWARGGGSAAGAFATRALRVDPGRDVPTLVLSKVQQGELPQWAFRKDAHRPDPFAVPA